MCVCVVELRLPYAYLHSPDGLNEWEQNCGVPAPAPNSDGRIHNSSEVRYILAEEFLVF